MRTSTHPWWPVNVKTFTYLLLALICFMQMAVENYFCNLKSFI
jgi:hypothetical protein